MNTIANRFFLFLTLTLFAYGAEAGDLCKVYNLGWHFYCDDKKTKQEEQDQKQALSEEQEVAEEAKAEQELEAMQKVLKARRIRAVMHPNDNNLARYLSFHRREVVEKSAEFARRVEKFLWKTPELDQMVKEPISTVGNSLLQEKKHKDKFEVLSKLNTRYGLFFFYNADCIYCQRFSPILKVFADHYGLEVMPVSMTGEMLEEWPSSEVDRGQAAKFGLMDKPVPAIILFDAETQKPITVGFGLLTVTELEERIYELTRVQ